MRILVVADEYPWPTRTGYRQRLHWVLRALATQGEVDLLAVVPPGRSGLEPPPVDLPLSRLAVVPAGARTGSRAARLARWPTGRQPRALLWRDWQAPRTQLQSWADGRYDLVWFSHAPAYLALADLVPAAHVVDLDNLDSSVLRHRRRNRVTSEGLRPRTGRARIGAVAEAVADAVDERRGRRLEHEIVRAGASVVVCSELDRRRLGVPGVRVVPNGYERAEVASEAGPAPARTVAPVLVMVGLLTYEPNRDAVAFFAAAVLPRIRQSRPGARFHVVGRHDAESQLEPWQHLPGVHVVGEVADVGAQLLASDIAVVPVRFGGGTRIKILEAFAHGLPVVSTTVGCEGLEVVDGQHLLVADDPEAFAAACLRLSEDAGLRARLVTAAARLWESRYRWSVLTPTVVDAVETALAAAARPPGHAASQADHDGPSAG